MLNFECLNSFTFTFISFLTLYTRLTITIEKKILTTIILGQITGKKNILYNETFTDKYLSKILLSQIISKHTN